MVNPRSSWGCRILWSCAVCFLLSPQNAHANDTTDYSIYAREAIRYRDDLIFLAVASMSFAFLIAFIASIFGYMAFLDHCIMKRYKYEGATIEAAVISTEVAQSGTVHRDICCGGTEQKECNVVVEYEQMLPSNDGRIKVRKKVGALESDFFHPDHHRERNVKTNPLAADTLLSLDSVLSPSQDEGDLEAGKGGPNKTTIIFNQDPFFQTCVVEERKLQMLVIEGMPKSGFPLQEHTRRMNFQYRLPSNFFLGLAFLTTIFCIHVGARLLFELVESRDLRREVAMMLIIGFVAAILLQLPCIHFTMNQAFQRMLEEEYFEKSGLTRTVPDDSTLSSKSDAYLLHNK